MMFEFESESRFVLEGKRGLIKGIKLIENLWPPKAIQIEMQ